MIAALRARWRETFRTQAGDRPRITWPLLKRVMRYAGPYRWQISVLLVMILISTTLSLLQPLIFRDLIDNTLPQKDLGRLNILALGLLALPLIGGALSVWRRKLNADVSEGLTYDLRLDLYDHLQRMSLRFFTNTRTGELMSRLNNDVRDAHKAVSDTILNTVTHLVQLIGTLGVMIALDWRLTLASMAVLPLFIPIARRSGAALRDIAREAMDDNAAMSAVMNETLNVGGVLLVKLFGRRRTEVDRFAGHAQVVRDIGVKRAVVGTRLAVVMSLVGAVGTAVIYWVGGYLVLRGVFTIGTIVAFTAYLSRLYTTLQNISNVPIAFATSLVSFERVFEVLDLPLDLPEKPDAIELTEVEGRLEFEHVSFAYVADEEHLLRRVYRPGQLHGIDAVLSGSVKAGEVDPAPSSVDAPPENELSPDSVEALPEGEPLSDEPPSQARLLALDDVTFTIEPGQLVALVGPSGAGKTTMTYLIPRLYDPTAGRILLDGIDLRDVTLDSLAAQIGVVTQETHLFHDTIRTNLRYAKLDATQDELEAACRAANIHAFIAGLPDGYDTVVGERGYRLSGGEKQRLAIARVILKDPRILVLDEATSHLDSQSEALIQDALGRVMAGRTSLVIAHRLSTILAADQILVLDRGRIVERGTHDALLAQAGLYAQLYETQFSQNESAQQAGQPI